MVHIASKRSNAQKCLTPKPPEFLDSPICTLKGSTDGASTQSISAFASFAVFLYDVPVRLEISDGKRPLRAHWESVLGHILDPKQFLHVRVNCLHFSICACHPCAGAMLIFSVSFQFQRMIPEGNPTRTYIYIYIDLCICLYYIILYHIITDDPRRESVDPKHLLCLSE